MTSLLKTEMLDDLFTEGVTRQPRFEYFSYVVKHLDTFIQWLLATIFGSIKRPNNVLAVATLTVCVNNYLVSKLATINPFHKQITNECGASDFMTVRDSAQVKNSEAFTVWRQRI